MTNPVAPRRTPPAESPSTAPDARIVSTAEDQSSSGADDSVVNNNEVGGARAGNGSRRAARPENEGEGESLQRTVNRLSTQVTGLTGDLNQLKEQQRTLINLERLTRAEQRGENLRAQLRDVMKQETDMQARAEQLEYELQPESIERRAALSGSARPEDVRAQLQRQLQAERERVRAQLDVLTSSRQRLETAAANADAETERLRQLIDRDTDGAAQTNRGDGAPTNAGSQTSARPSPPTDSAPPVPAPPF